MTKHPTTYFRITAIAILVVAIASYSLFQARNIIGGPLVEIHTPKNGSTLSESLVSIEGRAENITHISLNDRQIFVDERGKFHEQLLLSYGYNILAVKARDKFGRETEKILELVYK